MRMNVFAALLFVGVSQFLSTTGFAATAPSGFDEPGLMDQLQKGKIVQKDIVNTARELKVLYRSFFKGITVDDYINTVIDHDRYFKYLSDVKDSQRVKEVVANEQYEYKVTLNVSTPLGKMELEPALVQRIAKGATATDETLITDTVTNYEKDIKGAGFDTRIVPYDGGLLIAHTNYLNLKSATFFGSAKKDFREGNAAKVEELRDELKAKP
jgi:hypothetical protein